MGKEDTTAGEGAAASARTLSALDIQQKEFRVSRFGGYKMRDVDEFLDQLTDAFSALSAENERLRGGAPIVGSPDLDDVTRQADEIIARARAEATRITGEAKASAASPGVADGSTDRAGVTAFLTREREFLQSLAGLVQEHAEAVKGMARSSRSAPLAAVPAPAVPAPAATPARGSAAERPAPATTTAAEAQEAAVSKPGGRASEQAPSQTPEVDTEAAPEAAEAGEAPEVSPEAGEAPEVSPEAGEAPEVSREAAEEPHAQEEREGETPTRLPESEETVRLEEPAAARTARGDEPEGDRSLRELFWGED
jgi:DivIVA domain-containing protein